MPLFRSVVAALGLILLTACTGPGTKPDAHPPRPMREAIRAFSLEGRISVRRGTESHAALVAWTHLGAKDEIFVSTPLGQGLAALVGDASGATLETADRKKISAQDVEALSEKVFGARLPLRDLPSWVVGQPSAAAVRIDRDPAKRPSRLFEQGWQIDYLAYESERGDALPTLLNLQRGELEVRFKIDTWTLAQ